MTLKDPLTDPTRLHNPVPRTSTQSTDTEDSNPNPQKLAAKLEPVVKRTKVPTLFLLLPRVQQSKKVLLD